MLDFALSTKHTFVILGKPTQGGLSNTMENVELLIVTLNNRMYNYWKCLAVAYVVCQHQEISS